MPSRREMQWNDGGRRGRRGRKSTATPEFQSPDSILPRSARSSISHAITWRSIRWRPTSTCLLFAGDILESFCRREGQLNLRVLRRRHIRAHQVLSVAFNRRIEKGQSLPHFSRIIPSYATYIYLCYNVFFFNYEQPVKGLRKELRTKKSKFEKGQETMIRRSRHFTFQE